MWSSKNKIQLKQVTLAAISSVRLDETVSAMKYSMRGIKYEDVVLISHQQPEDLPEKIRFVEVKQIDSIDEYNRFLLFELYKYIQTEYVLIVHWDGFVVHPNQWRKEFLQYDYIGAPWPEELGFKDTENHICRVGNGVSLRSKKLLELPTELKLEWKHENEDTFLCCNHKKTLEENGLQIAPLDIAKFFSHERIVPEIKGIRPFLFHQWGGDNAQYPQFGSGMWVRCKKQVIRLLVWLGVWYPYQQRREENKNNG